MMWVGWMRRCASPMAIRRTSWIDQRINGGAVASAFFWGRRLVCPVTDRRHHGERQHDERDVAMPSVPGAGLVVIEPEFVFGGLEAALDGPASPLDRYEDLDVCSRRAPGREERQIAVAHGSTDQEAARPQARSRLVIFGVVEVGEFTVSPVMQSGALASLARRQPLPGRRIEAARGSPSSGGYRVLGHSWSQGAPPKRP